MRTMGVGASVVVAMLAAACGSGSASHDTGGTKKTPTPVPPVRRGDWTYYDGGQGLSGDVQDVSADEGGNVYVAGGDALYVKRRQDPRFLRFDADDAGLTKNCNDEAEIGLETPTKPFWQCRILSVGGAEPGKAIIVTLGS